MAQASKTKVAIIGAGNVGASVAFAMALQQSANEIVLIDEKKEKAVGEALDINHGLCFLDKWQFMPATILIYQVAMLSL